MTKEHAILVLDSLSTWLGHERPITEEIVEAIKTLSHHSLHSNLDKAAKEYAKTTFKKPHSDNPDEEVTIIEPDKYAGFIAGAKWMRDQMMNEAVEGWVAVDSDTHDKRRVTFFPKKPVRDVLTEYKYWAATRPRYESIQLDSNAFPNLKWEDEPKKVKFILIEED